MANTQLKLRQLIQDGAATNDVIKWNGSNWAPAALGGLTGSGTLGNIALWNGGSDLTQLAIGSAYTILTTNGAGTAHAYRQILGTTNRVTVTNNVGDITLSGPQDLHTGATPTFASLEITTAAPYITVSNTTTNSSLGGGRINLTANDGTGMVAGERLGSFYFTGFGATAFRTGSRLDAFAAETWSDIAAGSYFSIFTTANGTTTQVEAVRIEQDGDMSLRENNGIKLFNTANTFSAKLVSPSGLAANYTLILPVDDGTPNQVLSTNGTGTLSWSTPSSGSTNLGYTAATRILTSDTGTDVTLPLVTTGDAGLAPASGGGTTNFLRADGSWAAPAAPTGAALTKVDDTNVTVSLGGSPTTALLNAASITLGWTGTLSVARGGTGASTLTGILIGNGTSAFTATTGTANQLLRRNGANTAYEFFTPSYLTANQTITLSSDVTGSGTTGITATIANNAVTYAKMQDVTATNRFLGRITAGAGDPEELTPTQATSLLDLFSTTTTTKGLVPGSNSLGSTYFLNGSGAWSVPPSGGTPAGSSFQVQYNNAGAFGAETNFNYDPTNDRLVVGTTTATATLHGRAPNDTIGVIFRGENSTGNDIFNILASGHWKFGDNETHPRFYQSVATGGAVSYTGLGITADISFLSTGVEDGFGVNHSSLTASSGTKSVFRSTGTWAPTSGSATYYSMHSNPVINQTSTYSGISVGLGIIPTLTSVAVGQFYGIYLDVNNSNAYGIYQNGSNTSNYFNGAMSIGSTTIPGATALLQLDSTTKGFLLPRMTSTNRTGIGSAATGLMVYQTDATENLYIKKSSAWKRILTEDDGSGVTDHGALTGLGDDDHTQYALLAGRVGNQILYGGTGAAGTINIRGTSNGTPGDIILNSAGGNVTIGGGSTASELWLREPSGGGSEYIGFKAQTMSSSAIYSLPATAPSVNGSFLTSTTAGIMSWLPDHSRYAEVNTQTGTTYTLVIGDIGKTIDCTSSSAVTFTIPTNASVGFPTGSLIHVVQSGTGQITFGGSGVTINSADSKLKTRVRYSTVTLQKTATDTWLLFGDITT